MENSSEYISRVENVISALRRGEMIVLSDDADREDEGDLVCLAESIRADQISFMMNEGRGLICVSLSENKRSTLGLPLQVIKNEATFGTNFAVNFGLNSIYDLGLSAEGKAKSCNRLSEKGVEASEVVVPGYMVPVVGKDGGVMLRRGQTEGSLDLAKLATNSEVAVICEILDERGEVLRGKKLLDYCQRHELLQCSVDDVVRYRQLKDVSVRELISKELVGAEAVSFLREGLGDTCNGVQNKVVVFMDDVDRVEHFVVIFGEVEDNLKVRIHSECLTGDVFGSLKCDCGEQLDESLCTFISEGSGVLVYLRQEGRGIGLLNKLKAYELQEQGFDTVEANEKLGFVDDLRDYRIGANILRHLGLSRVRLLTNNPQKIEEISKYLEVTERIPLEVRASQANLSYLRTKKEKLGHMLHKL